jgi:hypothetical protein
MMPLSSLARRGFETTSHPASIDFILGTIRGRIKRHRCAGRMLPTGTPEDGTLAPAFTPAGALIS